MARHLAYLTLFMASVIVAGCAGRQSVEREPGHAKNVILFIGDGMGVSTVTAARIFVGQSKGLAGEEYSLPFEKFPHVALIKTYNTNQQVPDSAGTASAIATGHKTRAGVISVGPEGRRRNCEESLAHPLTSITEVARSHGKSIGIVTTARITHATPAAFYAHSPEREWESDRFLPASEQAAGCHDIAWQFTHSPAGAITVAMGGGRAEFFGSDHGGERQDPKANLVHDWIAGAPDRRYITTAGELRSVAEGGELLGLFNDSHMTYTAERTAESTEPTLAEMTAAAIDRLAGADGFFLIVEAGRIDHGHHDGKAGYALLEAQELATAVTVALQKVNLHDSLVMVTADHSHTFTMGGYPTRGNPILGLVVGNDANGEPRDRPARAADGKPYTTLQYANGPGAVGEGPRPVPETGINAVYQALVPLRWKDLDGTVDNDETHGGEDVPLYATGAGSDAVAGVMEQNLIFDVMMQAYGW